MRIVITLMGGFFLFAAIYVTVMNWGCMIVSLRNQRRGIDRHHSTVPIITVLLAFFALFMWPYWPHAWVLLIPILDIANLNLVIWPIWSLVGVTRKRGSDVHKQK